MSESSLRQILIEACSHSDFTDATLRAQAAAIDVQALKLIISRLCVRAEVLAHAVDVMTDGTFTHPIQAFMHATHCGAINTTRMPDSEFYSLLTIWGKLCDGGRRDGTAGQFDPFVFRE